MAYTTRYQEYDSRPPRKQAAPPARTRVRVTSAGKTVAPRPIATPERSALPAPSPYGGGGGYGGGGYGGGPYGGVPTPGGPGGASTTAPGADPAKALQEAELEAALRALEKQFNLSREQLMADQTEAGDQYRFLLSSLQRSRTEALQGVESSAIGRGILRSGIFLQDQGQVQSEFARQQGQIEQDRAGKLQAIQAALAELEAQFAQAQGGTTADAIRQQIEALKQQAQAYAL